MNMTAQKIINHYGKIQVPDYPIIPFIEGDGTGPDIWAASVRVLDAAVEKAYNGKRKISWKEVYAGEKAYNMTGKWLPEETLDTIHEHLVAIKGPLTTLNCTILWMFHRTTITADRNTGTTSSM